MHGRQGVLRSSSSSGVRISAAPELRHMKRLPSQYLRRFTCDTIGHDDCISINMNLVQLVGADRVTYRSNGRTLKRLRRPMRIARKWR